MPLAAHHHLFFLLYLLRGAATASAAEVDVLLAFKCALVTISPKASEFFATWDNTAASPCNYTGVTCSGSHITSISVPGQKVVENSVPFHDICASLPTRHSIPAEERACWRHRRCGRVHGAP